MRNSLLPLIGVFLVGILAVLAIPGGYEVGQDGPQLSPGILRLPKDARKSVTSAPLQAENTVSVTRPASRVPGLEPDAWRVVAVVAADDKAMTRAVVLGLAERLTERGSIAIVAVAAKAPLPLAVDRVLTISSSDEAIPDAAAGACRGTITVHQAPVMLPATHPALGLQGASGVADTELSIAHRSVSPGTEQPRWASRFAAVGRSIGDQCLNALAGPAGLPGEWDRAKTAAAQAPGWTFKNPKSLLFILVVPLYLIVRQLMLRRLPPDHPQRTYRWSWFRPTVISVALVAGALWIAKPEKVAVKESAPDHQLATWTTHFPIVPSMAVLRWHGCFADELVRGWVGRIGGTRSTDRGGNPISADKPVLDWLGKYEEKLSHDDPSRWHQQPPLTGEPRSWYHEKGGAEEFFLIARDERGFDCVLWQEQARAASVHARWLEAAEDPVLARASRRRLRRHQLCQRIPDDQRAEAAAVLRRDPDAAEVCMLAELPDATEGEKTFAKAARYAYGRETAPPTTTSAPTWARMVKGATVSFDGRPTLLQAGEDYVLVLCDPDGGGELVARTAQGSARTAIAADGTATLALPSGTLVLAAGHALTWR